MLILKNIEKEYTAGDETVHALRGVELAFRENEFVSVLGPSGCGKTTLLNIIGGLDRFTSGDLIINGRSTREYKERDWDAYRNHSIGFVFQSYNLIPHQSVLANVELALTLSGVSKAERRRRAKEALEMVGLGNQLRKKPNQMSGGQMQRVAIARALVNNPDILLADEPTGALDTETSVQIMEILKNVAADKLVIMVTHNPELAEQYSTRIVRLLDGRVVGDTDPYSGSPEYGSERRIAERGQKKPSMSLFTALSLSLNNLLTKKTRTLLTAFAGSIGIIGIALILALSNGIQSYIDRVQEDTLSTYPLSIESESVDVSTLMSTLTDAYGDGEPEHALDKVYSNSLMADMMDTMLTMDVQENDLGAFKTFLEDEDSGLEEYISDIKYSYDIPLYIYSESEDGGVERINPSAIFDSMMSNIYSDNAASAIMSTGTSVQVWQEMISNEELLDSQYDVIAGRWPSAYNEVVLVVDKNNEINDLFLYSLGLKDSAELNDMIEKLMNGETVDAEQVSYEYDELIGKKYKLLLPTDFYRYDEKTDTWEDMTESETYMTCAVENAEDIEIVGVIRPAEDAVASSVTGAIGYTPALTEYIVERTNAEDIVAAQRGDESRDVFSGLPFDDGSGEELSDAEKAELFRDYAAALGSAEKAVLYTDMMSVPDEAEMAAHAQQTAASMSREELQAMLVTSINEAEGMSEEAAGQYLASLDDEAFSALAISSLTQYYTDSYAEETAAQLGALTADECAAMLDAAVADADDGTMAEWFEDYMPAYLSDSTYEENLERLGVVSLDRPSEIQIYAATFEAKDGIISAIDDYNLRMTEEGHEELVISYTDYVGLIMSSVSNVINIISYVLIAFVSISLVVSSIMIGIITYISVLERTKEIGILRSIGASRRDISRVFNAETLIVGFTSGAMGIVVTLLLCIPANAIVKSLTDVSNIALLPPLGGALLVAISMLLTFIAGLIPSRIAAMKDPVVALRTE